ncbi:MAG: MBL fold metallo-hydrolase [Ignavibacteriae bacterium]|nr:MBL fold metallo-hydrolase [Ignavibacteriota bacterium]
MKIQFCGAAQTVTGSQHLLEINGKKILLDCGMSQGKREESFQINRHFLFDPAELHCVILSHAHIDHAGNLPTLYAKGFTGRIYCTSATRDLCSIMLQDSAYIQEKDTEFVNKRRAKRHEPLFNPLYTIEDARGVLECFEAFPYNKKIFIDGLDNKVEVTFIEAGHILGSSQVLLDIEENGKKFILGFTGDLGRYHLPILKDPDFLGNVDILLSESTYGGRTHHNAEMIESELEATVKEAIEAGGKIIVPSFSVGRTQELVYALTELETAGKIPKFPIFVDSPLTVNATDVFKLHPECFDKETSDYLASGVNVFGLDNVEYIKDVNDSKKLNEFKGTCMIISASGMCEAGRILHHLANNISNNKNVIMIIGFMAENTLGRRIVEAKDTPGTKVKIFGEEHKVKAKIRVLNAFSGHADQNELIAYLNKFDKNILKKLFLVHGELEGQKILEGELRKSGFKNIFIPKRGEGYNI